MYCAPFRVLQESSQYKLRFKNKGVFVIDLSDLGGICKKNQPCLHQLFVFKTFLHQSLVSQVAFPFSNKQGIHSCSLWLGQSASTRLGLASHDVYVSVISLITNKMKRLLAEFAAAIVWSVSLLTDKRKKSNRWGPC